MMNFSGGIAGFLWTLFMIIFMALPFIVGLWILFAFVEWLKDKKNSHKQTPLGILNTRLAKGEISYEEFLKLKEQLQ